MFIRSLIITHFLLFFVGTLPRDLVKGMRKAGESSKSSHPKKLKTGGRGFMDRTNALSLTELSFLIRILELVEDTEVEQNGESIQDVLRRRGEQIIHQRGVTMSPEIAQNFHTFSNKIANLITKHEQNLAEAIYQLKHNTAQYTVENKIELIVNRHTELSENPNNEEEARQILSRYNISDLDELNNLHPRALTHLLNELLEPTQGEKNLYIFSNLMGEAWEVTSTFLHENNEQLQNTYAHLVGDIGKELDLEKYQHVCACYPGKIYQGVNKLISAETTFHLLNTGHQENQPGFMDIVQQITNRIGNNIFAEFRANENYENVHTIWGYVRIIFTK
uniref:Secreted protein n=1 Tax=Meloidogyne floridensis TaxID=298350 RepID=A0A915NH58_9BILA